MTQLQRIRHEYERLQVPNINHQSLGVILVNAENSLTAMEYNAFMKEVRRDFVESFIQACIRVAKER